MGISRPNMDNVDKVRKKLKSEGMLNKTAIKELRASLRKKKEKTSLLQINTRRELTETIAALDHLLKTE